MNEKNTPPNAETGGAMLRNTPDQSVTVLGQMSHGLTAMMLDTIKRSDPDTRAEYAKAYKLFSNLARQVIPNDDSVVIAWRFDHEGFKGFVCYQEDDAPEPVLFPLLLEGPTVMFGNEDVSVFFERMLDNL